MKRFIKENWYKLAAAAILIIAIADHPYSYYQLTRWVTTIIGLYLAYTYHQEQRVGLMWLFIALSILFNPIAPFYLEKSTWHLFDLFGGVLFIISVFIKPKHEIQ